MPRSCCTLILLFEEVLLSRYLTLIIGEADFIALPTRPLLPEETVGYVTKTIMVYENRLAKDRATAAKFADLALQSMTKLKLQADLIFEYVSTIPLTYIKP